MLGGIVYYRINSLVVMANINLVMEIKIVFIVVKVLWEHYVRVVIKQLQFGIKDMYYRVYIQISLV